MKVTFPARNFDKTVPKGRQKRPEKEGRVRRADSTRIDEDEIRPKAIPYSLKTE